MRLTVDRDLCQGHGVCESEAPAVFTVGDDRQVAILDASPPDDQDAAVRAAVKYCPTHALILNED